MHFLKRQLKVAPVIVVVDDMADLAIEHADHVAADHHLGHGHLSSEVDVRAEDDEWKHMADEIRNKIDESIEGFFLL